MRLTVTERDNKRLLTALVLACGLYGGLLCLAAAVRLPDARMAESAYGTIRVSLAPAVRREAPRAPVEARTQAKEEPRQDAQPSPDGLLQSVPVSENIAPAESVPAEISVAAVSQGEQIFVAGNAADTGQTASHGMIDQAAEDRARFLSWLDAEVKKKLVYPDKARRRNIEGTVTVRLDVPAGGLTCDAVVSGGSGSAVLDRAAIDLVRSLFPAKIGPGEDFTDLIRIEYRLLED